VTAIAQFNLGHASDHGAASSPSPAMAPRKLGQARLGA